MYRRFIGCVLLLAWGDFPACAQEKKPADLAKRISIEAKVSVKNKNGNASMNDVRQEITGYFLLKDESSIYDAAVGGLRGKYWIIGQSVGGWSLGGTGKYVIFQRGDWDATLPLKGTAQIPIQETKTLYDKTGSSRFGYEYFGYLLVIQDESGGSLVVKTSRKDFENGVSSFLKLEEKMTFDKDLSPKDSTSWIQ